MVLLGLSGENFTSKFSVMLDEECALVHVHFTPNGCFARCMKGACQNNPFLTRRRIPKGLSMETRGDRKQVCHHLDTFFANCELLRCLFLRYFPPAAGSAVQEEEGEAGEENVDFQAGQGSTPDEPVELDDILLEVMQEKVSFDIEKGTWVCSSHSQYQTCSDMLAEELVGKTAHRSCYVKPDELLEGGQYRGPILKPAIPEGLCQWGSAFTSEEFPDGLPTEPTHEAKVYTKSVRISTTIHNSMVNQQQ